MSDDEDRVWRENIGEGRKWQSKRKWRGRGRLLKIIEIVRGGVDSIKS